MAKKLKVGFVKKTAFEESTENSKKSLLSNLALLVPYRRIKIFARFSKLQLFVIIVDIRMNEIFRVTL